MKKSILTMLLLLMAIASFAQQRLISGQITDRDTKEAIEQVTIQLLKSDSTYVAGAISNEHGLFHVTAPANGKYLLKISSVGYKSTVKRIQISDNKDLAMGKIVLGAEAIMLKGAVVTAMAQKVTLKEDTFVYNSSAYQIKLQVFLFIHLYHRMELNSFSEVSLFGRHFWVSCCQ